CDDTSSPAARRRRSPTIALTIASASIYLVLHNRTRRSLRRSVAGAKAIPGGASTLHDPQGRNGWRLDEEQRTKSREGAAAQTIPLRRPAEGHGPAPGRAAPAQDRWCREAGRRRRRRRPCARHPRRLRAHRQSAHARGARAPDEVLQEHDSADLAVAAAARVP